MINCQAILSVSNEKVSQVQNRIQRSHLLVRHCGSESFLENDTSFRLLRGYDVVDISELNQTAVRLCELHCRKWDLQDFSLGLFVVVAHRSRVRRARVRWFRHNFKIQLPIRSIVKQYQFFNAEQVVAELSGSSALHTVSALESLFEAIVLKLIEVINLEDPFFDEVINRNVEVFQNTVVDAFVIEANFNRMRVFKVLKISFEAVVLWIILQVLRVNAFVPWHLDDHYAFFKMVEDVKVLLVLFCLSLLNEELMMADLYAIVASKTAYRCINQEENEKEYAVIVSTLVVFSDQVHEWKNEIKCQAYQAYHHHLAHSYSCQHDDPDVY